MPLFWTDQFFAKIHFPISFSRIFLPYISIPTRYIRAAINVVRIKPPTNKVIEMAICHHGGLNGKSALITTGEVSGITEPQKPNWLSGLLITLMAMKMEIIIGTVMGTIKDCWSPSSPIAAPTAANKEP